ncbi:2,3-dihydro-2,3-dihydroxybenzoate dehydrogenase [Nocardiopsis potens]|uniref:2,3-dihydro-2,3-dihydroxybenzoate dehydrogenase n=1 Tax=Nocardiopsis potens TaxID=1246458 RepID=UPI00034AC4FF|nr:2,3-dihydro-2,3-dihydroxybenzoate dehydrogenase [Nocardiopsis potens]
MSHNGIEGTVALVTGAGQGIGAAVARALAEAGARVAAADLAEEPLRGTAAALAADGHDVRPYPCDVRDPEAVEELFAAAERDLGPVRHAVSVAGVLRTGPGAETSDADWAELIAVNATGVFHVLRAAANRMVLRGAGTITTVGSNAGTTPRAGLSAYGASKAAAAAFTRALALEVAGSGVRCNVVSPGSTDTPMQRGMWSGPDGAAKTVAGDPALFRTGIPLGRIAAPEDVAAAVRFLASSDARHVTAHDLRVDGGATPC